MIITRCKSMIVEILCAMMMTVMFAHSFAIVFFSRAVVWGSTFAVHSSKHNIWKQKEHPINNWRGNIHQRVILSKDNLRGRSPRESELDIEAASALVRGSLLPLVQFHPILPKMSLLPSGDKSPEPPTIWCRLHCSVGRGYPCTEIYRVWTKHYMLAG